MRNFLGIKNKFHLTYIIYAMIISFCCFIEAYPQNLYVTGRGMKKKYNVLYVEDNAYKISWSTRWWNAVLSQDIGSYELPTEVVQVLRPSPNCFAKPSCVSWPNLRTPSFFSKCWKKTTIKTWTLITVVREPCLKISQIFFGSN